MNNDLFSTLKRLLENTMTPKELALFDDNISTLTVLDEKNEYHFMKNMNSQSLRVLRTIELQQFTEEGLRYYFELEKLNFLNGQLREELLSILFLNHLPITPHRIKIAILGLISPKMPSMEKLFLDFVLTPQTGIKH